MVHEIRKPLVFIVIAAMLLSMFQMQFVQKAYADGTTEANFTDLHLKQFIADWVGKTVTDAVYESDIDAKLSTTPGRYLDLSGIGITDLSGMEIFNDLQVNGINLSDNHIADVSPISGIQTLRSINIENNQISSIDSLSALPLLDTLIADNNQIIGIPTSLGVIRNLSLRNNVVSDFAGLAGLTTLRSLNLENTGMQSVDSLSNLTSLETLDISNNEVSDISELAGLTEIRQLTATNNRITDVSPLTGMTWLSHLNLSGNQITNTSPLNLMHLDYLNLNQNQIEQLRLPNTTNLRELHISGNRIASLDDLQNAPMLNRLFAFGNQISDLSPVATIATLTFLDVSNNLITDITDLDGLNNLINLDVRNNFINIFEGDNKTFLDNHPAMIKNTGFQKRLILIDESTADQTNQISVSKSLAKSVRVSTEHTIDGISFMRSVDLSPAIHNISMPDLVAISDINGFVKEVQGLDEGQAQITFGIANGTTGWGLATLSVEVSPPPVVITSLKISPIQSTINVGQSQQFTATAHFSDSTTNDVTNIASWTVSNGHADVTPLGEVEGFSAGSVIITAEYNGLTATADVDVIEQQIPQPSQPPVVTPPIVEMPTPEPEPILEPELTPEPIIYGTVRGSVKYESTGEPIANIKIEIRSEPQIAVTNELGEYFFENVPLGVHSIRLIDEDLKDIGEMSTIVGDFMLEHNPYLLELTSDNPKKELHFFIHPFVKVEDQEEPIQSKLPVVEPKPIVEEQPKIAVEIPKPKQNIPVPTPTIKEEPNIEPEIIEELDLPEVTPVIDEEPTPEPDIIEEPEQTPEQTVEEPVKKKGLSPYIPLVAVGLIYLVVLIWLRRTVSFEIEKDGKTIGTARAIIRNEVKIDIDKAASISGRGKFVITSSEAAKLVGKTIQLYYKGVEVGVQHNVTNNDLRDGVSIDFHVG